MEKNEEKKKEENAKTKTTVAKTGKRKESFISISDNQLTYGLGTYIKKGFRFLDNSIYIPI